ncbi:helix-turn-helix domain-containing protein [Sphingomonas morindae]|uniref:Helix-turn-helix domain-containing protein n=1 Tax=Sphingomonas morindae TaxID=1541170 RepID=A0ABY4X5U5_9SPHN|nr:helix-turn-helix domain-containing protein [Sphingomonas morindae]USI72278.1 helix-turn-helix domain-containing protein [Sphingomonas morindae]
MTSRTDAGGMMDEAKQTPDSVGVRLRAAREDQGQSLDDIGRQTRVPVRHLVQIEEGRLEGLPAAPYSAGFVKAYARAVGLDPTALANQFRAEFDRAKAGTHRIAYEPYEPADPSRLPPRLLALVALVLAVLVIGGYAIWRSGLVSGEGADMRAKLAARGDESTPVSPAPAATPAAAPAPGTPAAPGAPAAGAPAPAAGGAVLLTAKVPTWVKISERGGATLFIGTLDQGKSFPVPASAVDPVIRTGRPEGLEVTVGGRPVPPLGAPAHTISNVSLKAEALLARGGGAAAAATAPAPTPAPAPTTPDESAPPAFRATGR